MSDLLKCFLVASKERVVNTPAGQVITVTLKGQKTVTHNNNGYELDDTVEASVVLKFGMSRTGKALGVDLGSTKILLLRDRDESLSDYEMSVSPVMQEKIA